MNNINSNNTHLINNENKATGHNLSALKKRVRQSVGEI
jgi:hypothetical protein